MIVVSGIVKIELAHRDRALRLIEPLMAATNEEAGCISYAFFEDPFCPGRFRVFEEWTDLEALTRHFDMPHMGTFRQGLAGLGKIESDVVRYDVARFGPNR
jgi:quinol monooxygenase YgiN